MTFYMFALFNALRVVSYIPQIAAVARDRNGASAIAYSTWVLWVMANATTALHAGINLHDHVLMSINLLNASCSIAVIVVTVSKRRRMVADPRGDALPAEPR
jgi:hypothetical protein